MPENALVSSSVTPSLPDGMGACGLFDLGLSSDDDFPPLLDSGGNWAIERGQCVGPYRLMRELGVGGFGVVWLASQAEPIQREVAIKLIKPGMGSRRVISRFELERQTLAKMEHPNIASVLDAGATPQGHPYFVMELVRGEPITVFCDRRSFSIQQRLELFLQVCLGIQHAHQKAILHRDLKPSNILVEDRDGTPVPKIIDFGIAKALAPDPESPHSVYNNTRSLVIGTPQYMSPEQAMGSQDVDVCSDVYSLGTILFELLTGRLPFPDEDFHTCAMHMLQVIREKDPARPSTLILSALEDPRTKEIALNRKSDPRRLGQELRGDLDWVVLKALEKERARRYESASAFAADIQRHLRFEPVVARPPTRLYILRKFIRRNRVAAFAGCLVALALIVGAWLAGWGYMRQKEALAQSRASEGARLKQVIQSKRVADFLEDMMAEISRRNSRTLTASAILDLLDSVEKRRDEKLAQDPETDLRVSHILAQAYCELNRLEPAERLFSNALNHLLQFGRGNTLEAANCQFWIVWIHLRQIDDTGITNAAPLDCEREMLRRCLDTRTALLARTDETLVRTQALQIELLRLEGKTAEATALLQSFTEGPDRAALEKTAGWGWLLCQRASLSLKQNQYDAASADLETARKILMSQGTESQRFQAGVSIATLKRTMAMQAGQFGDAEEAAQQESSYRQTWLGREEPSVLTDLAEVYLGDRNFDGALNELIKAVKLIEQFEASNDFSQRNTKERALRLLVRYREQFHPGNILIQLPDVTELTSILLTKADELRVAGRPYADNLAEAARFFSQFPVVPEPFPAVAAPFFSARASLAVRQLRYSDAIADLARAERADPEKDFYRFQTVTLCLASGDEKGYVAVRDRLLSRLGNKPAPEALVLICRAVLLTPGIEPKAIGKLRNLIGWASLSPSRPDDDWIALLTGMTSYRSGDYRDATLYFDFAQRSPDPIVSVQAQLYSAMNQRRLRNPDARVSLNKALDAYKDQFARFSGTDFTIPFHDYLAVTLLKRESEKLFDPQPQQPKRP